MAAPKWHIGKRGNPTQCRATGKRGCPLGENMPHFNSPEEANAYIETKAALENATVPNGVSRKATITAKAKNAQQQATRAKIGDPMSPEAKALRATVKTMSENIVKIRAEGSELTLEDAKPTRAQRRLEEAIEYANSRQNSHLAAKLAQAKVAPSGKFVRADGTKFSVETIAEKAKQQRHIEDGRTKLLSALNRVASEGNLPAGSYKATSGNVTVSASVKDGGFNEKEYNNLSEESRRAIEAETEYPDINKVREKLPPEVQQQVLNRTQVYDHVIGEASGDSQPFAGVTVNTDFSGESVSEKFESGVKSVAEFYSAANSKFGGTSKSRKSDIDDLASDVKAYAARSAPGQKIFVPGRSYSTGGVVTERDVLSPAKLKQLVSEKEWRSVQSRKMKPSPELAKQHLDEASYNKIFNAKVASIRVTEK